MKGVAFLSFNKEGDATFHTSPQGTPLLNEEGDKSINSQPLDRIISHFFFVKSTISEVCYGDILDDFLFSESKVNLIFHQDEAPPHYALFVTSLLRIFLNVGLKGRLDHQAHPTLTHGTFIYTRV